MLNDTVNYVRQSVLIAMSLVCVKHAQSKCPQVTTLQKKLYEAWEVEGEAVSMIIMVAQLVTASSMQVVICLSLCKREMAKQT